MFYKQGSVETLEVVVKKENWRDFVKDTSVYLTKEAIDNIIEESAYLKKEDFSFYLARFVSAGERWGFNGNRDYFPREELKKAYKSFLRRGVYINHDNYPKDKAIGIIPWVDYDEEGDYVYGVLAISKEYQDVIDKIDNGEVEGTSMGCVVNAVQCPICGKEATTEEEYCEHLNNKLKFNAYEICKGVNFIEQSVLINEPPADGDALIVEKLAKKDKKRDEEWRDNIKEAFEKYSIRILNDKDEELSIDDLHPGSKIEFKLNGEIVEGELRELSDNELLINLPDGGSHSILISRNNKIVLKSEKEVSMVNKKADDLVKEVEIKEVEETSSFAGVRCEGQDKYLLVQKGAIDQFYDGLAWWLENIGFDNLAQKIEDIGKTGFIEEMKKERFCVRHATGLDGFVDGDDPLLTGLYDVKKDGTIAYVKLELEED